MPDEEIMPSEAKVKDYETTLTFGETGEVKHITDKIVGRLCMVKIIPDFPQTVSVKIYDQDNFLIFKKSDLSIAGMFYPDVTPTAYEEGPPRPEDKFYISGEGKYILNEKLKIYARGSSGKRIRMVLRYM